MVSCTGKLKHGVHFNLKVYRRRHKINSTSEESSKGVDWACLNCIIVGVNLPKAFILNAFREEGKETKSVYRIRHVNQYIRQQKLTNYSPDFDETWYRKRTKFCNAIDFCLGWFKPFYLRAQMKYFVFCIPLRDNYEIQYDSYIIKLRVPNCLTLIHHK